MIQTYQNGFTLLEVLVTLVVVSIGLLGVLGLQTVGLSNTQISHARSLATVAADNIAERMRANSIGVDNNDYANISHPSGGGASAPTDCSSETCTPAQMAAFDSFHWDQRLGQLLPNGRGRITCVDVDTGDSDNCSPNSSHVITVIWAERDKVADRAGTVDKCTALNASGDNITDRCFQTSFLP